MKYDNHNSSARHSSAKPNASDEFADSQESLRIDTETIRVIGQSIPNMLPMSDSAAGGLALDVEYRLREIVQDAVKFMKHSKRNKLTPNDTNSALRLRNVAPVVGFGNPKVNARKAIENNSTDRAHPNGYRKSSVIESQNLHFSNVEGGDGLFLVHDKEKAVKSLLEGDIPVVPCDVSLSRHWLAVTGKQPSIPQNSKRTKRSLIDDDRDSEPAAKRLKSSFEVKPLVRHELSRELQLYLEQITTSMQGDDPKHLEQCLYAVAEEKGIAELLPYFTQFVYICVTKGGNLQLMFCCMRLINAILDNDIFDLSFYLQQVLPAVLTCMVGKRFTRNPRDNHWALRDYASTVMKKICDRYGRLYTDIQPRITKTCASALDNTRRPLTTHYGAIVGLATLGRRVTERHLLPRLAQKTYVRSLEKIITTSSTKPIRKQEACKVFGALLWAVSAGYDSKSDGVNSAYDAEVQVKPFLSYLPSAEAVYEIGKRELGKQFHPQFRGTSDVQIGLLQ